MTATPYIERLVAVLQAAPDRPCLRHKGRDVRAGDLLRRICGYARVLQRRGIGRGDIVALLAPNCPDALAVRYAANLIGAGATFLSNPGSCAARSALIDSIAPRLLVVFPETAGLVPPGLAVPLAGVDIAPAGGFDLREAMTALSEAPLASLARPDDLAVIVSSGGSTGVPKGSWRTFASYTAMVSVPSPADRRQLINGPLAYLSQVLVDITLLGGGTVVFKDRYEAISTAAAIEAERITDLFLVEPQLFDFMDHPCLGSTDLSSLRTLTHIGASAPPTLRRRARERFGPRIVHTYGASEEGLVSLLGATEHDLDQPALFSCAGRLLPSVEIRFRRVDGTLGKHGDIGCIEVRSPAVAQGYLNRRDLEGIAFQDGWYRSGDLGRLDADGRLHILGRAVDIDFADGRMVTPTSIEDTLCRLPAVRYAAVVVDAEAGRRIAVVRPWAGACVDTGECAHAIALAHGEAVAGAVLILVREEVPLTPQGKPDREAIRALGRDALRAGRTENASFDLAVDAL